MVFLLQQLKLSKLLLIYKQRQPEVVKGVKNLKHSFWPLPFSLISDHRQILHC